MRYNDDRHDLNNTCEHAVRSHQVEGLGVEALHGGDQPLL